MNHPKYQGVGVAEDGSQVELWLSDGTSIAFEIGPLNELIRDLISTLAAANANVTRNKQPATQQMEAVPLVILASDVNVIRMRETDTFSIDASDEKNRRVIVTLREEHMRFLVDVYQKTRSPPPGQKPN